MFAPEAQYILKLYNGNDLVDSETLQDDVDFRYTNKTHDWRNHVPYQFRKNRANLSESVRATVYVMAQIAADQEEWE